jgi:hypothetical protein
VHTIEDGSLPYFDVKPNLINVAVSRAKHSFLVFGDMRYFDPARQRQVQVTVVFDPEQNKERGAFRATTDEGLALLRRAGAELREIARIHNKTLAVDDRWIVEGSFNWLSAARDPQALFARQERSLRYDGPLARNYCDKAWSELERPEWKPQ